MTLRDIRNVTKDNQRIEVFEDRYAMPVAVCGRGSGRNKNALNDWLDYEVIGIEGNASFSSGLTVIIDIWGHTHG